MPLEPGTRLGPYEVIAVSGAGGMGEVYRARDTRLNRSIALKVLPSDVANDADRLRRFEQEAQAASALNHPNIVTIYDIGHEAGVSFIAMEWVQGETLRALLGRGVPVRQLAGIAHQAADGLANAHAAGIVHRDLKPDNIMISGDGLVKIVDFGLAKLNVPAAAFADTVTAASGTAAGMVMGTVGYMSPEQASGRQVDYRSDQFALGLIAYEGVTGKRPFARATAAQTIAATIDAEPEPVSTLNPAVPAHLALVIHRCLEKNPANRYESTRDLAHDFKHAASGPFAISTPRRQVPRRLAIAAGVVLLIAAAAAAALTWRTRAPAADGTAPLVAVRGFRNLSQDPAQSFFSEGVTDEIRGQLSKISALRVLSRSAVEQFGERGWAVDRARVRRAQSCRRQRPTRARSGARDRGTGRCRDPTDAMVGAVRPAVVRRAQRAERSRAADRAAAGRHLVARRAGPRRETTDNQHQSVRTLPARAGHQRHGRPESQRLGNRAAAAGDCARSAVRAGQGHSGLPRLLPRVRRRPEDADEAIAMALDAAAVDPTLADPHFVLGSAYGLLGRIEQSRQSFLRALELNPNHLGSMDNLSYAYALAGRLDESLYWARRAWPLSAQQANAFYHISVPLVWIRDDVLTERWLAEAERRGDAARTQWMLAAMQFYRGASSIENALILLRHKLKTGIKVIKEYEPDLPEIQAYGAELSQVWINLIDNGIFAMDGEGVLTIAIGRDEDGVAVDDR